MGISIRDSIRWVPDEAGEPTSTIVITSPQSRFVDVRVLKGDETSADLPLSRLDWAIAGTTSRWTLPDGTQHGQWKHWIDSRTTSPEDATDEGDEFELEDGSTLEKGSMVNPATGKETEYEEVWRSVDARGRFMVMETQGPDGVRGRAVLLGGYCQGLLREGEDVSVQRWVREQDGRWRMVVRMGEGQMPCQKMVEEKWETGHEVVEGGRQWDVVEAGETE